jgi:hypothetical protein
LGETIYCEFNYATDDNYKNIDIMNDSNVIILLTFYPVSAIKNTVDNKILYPNPTYNYVILEDDVPLNTYNLIDNTGSILKIFDIETTPYQLDISDLPTGNYFIIDISKTIFYKFIKQ